jgi:hypothetical protein
VRGRRYGQCVAAALAAALHERVAAALHYKLGLADEARRSLSRAQDWIERADRNQGVAWDSRWMTWYEQVEVAQLLEEARELFHAVP